MISCDTNVLFAACNQDSAHHSKARALLKEWASRSDVCLCEQVLMELYCLLRNPTVSTPALAGPDAVEIVRAFRTNPRWRIVDMVPGHGIMEHVWSDASGTGFAYRRIFDARLARVLRHHSVDRFATCNVRDFGKFGFTEVWDPFK